MRAGFQIVTCRVVGGFVSVGALIFPDLAPGERRLEARILQLFFNGIRIVQPELSFTGASGCRVLASVLPWSRFLAGVNRCPRASTDLPGPLRTEYSVHQKHCAFLQRQETAMASCDRLQSVDQA